MFMITTRAPQLCVAHALVPILHGASCPAARTGVVYDLPVSRIAVLAVPDLLFQSRIEAALRGCGLDVRVPASQAACLDVLAGGATLAVIDLQAQGYDAQALIEAAKRAGARVLAFGRHTDPAALRAAREAGADLAVARSQLAEELPALLDELLRAPGAGRPGAQPSREGTP